MIVDDLCRIAHGEMQKSAARRNVFAAGMLSDEVEGRFPSVESDMREKPSFKCAAYDGTADLLSLNSNGLVRLMSCPPIGKQFFTFLLGHRRPDADRKRAYPSRLGRSSVTKFSHDAAFQ